MIFETFHFSIDTWMLLSLLTSIAIISIALLVRFRKKYTSTFASVIKFIIIICSVLTIFVSILSLIYDRTGKLLKATDTRPYVVEKVTDRGVIVDGKKVVLIKGAKVKEGHAYYFSTYSTNTEHNKEKLKDSHIGDMSQKEINARGTWSVTQEVPFSRTIKNDDTYHAFMTMKVKDVRSDYKSDVYIDRLNTQIKDKVKIDVVHVNKQNSRVSFYARIPDGKHDVRIEIHEINKDTNKVVQTRTFRILDKSEMLTADE